MLSKLLMILNDFVHKTLRRILLNGSTTVRDFAIQLRLAYINSLIDPNKAFDHISFVELTTTLNKSL